LTDLNVHRVVITAILLAAKFFDDAYYNNAYYSKVGGVLVSEMNGLEVDFLFRINFSLHVQPDMFHKYKAELVAHAIHAGLSTTSPSSLAPSPVVQPSPTLPQIAEALENVVNAQRQQQFVNIVGATIQQQQHQQHYVGGSLPQVTPSPSEQQQQLEYASVSIPLPLPTSQQHAVAQQQLLQQQLWHGSIPHQTGLSNNNQPFQAVQQHHLYMPGLASSDQVTLDVAAQLSGVVSNPIDAAVAVAQQELIHHHHQTPQQQQQQQNNFMQRSNSLPPILTQPTPFGSRCVEYTQGPPYHSAPVAPSNLPLPLVNVVDQDKYQLVMNQLFPIQPTLVHHDHAAAAAATATVMSVPAPVNQSNGSSSSVAHTQHHVINHTTYVGSSATGAPSIGNLGSVMAYQ
jgi:Cyclin